MKEIYTKPAIEIEKFNAVVATTVSIEDDIV